MITRVHLISFFFLALLSYVFFSLTKVFSPFFEAIFWAAVLAFAFKPLHKKIQSWNVPEAASAGLTVLIVFFTVAPLIALIVMKLAGEAIRSYDYFAQFIQSGRLDQVIEDIRKWPFVQRLKSHAIVWDFIKDHSQSWILKGGQFIATTAAAETASFTKNLLFLFLNFLLTLFLCFFFLKDGHHIYNFVYGLTPLEDNDKTEIFSRTFETFQAVIHGQIFTAFVQAGLSALIFTCLGLPLPILFAGLTFFFSLVPILGAATVWVPFVAYLLITGHIIKAVILLFLGIFGISLIDNFLKPVLIGEKTKLPYMVLFLGILGGLRVYGLMGVFLVPIFLSVLLVLIKIYRERFSI